MAFEWGGKRPQTPVRLKQRKFKPVEVGKGSAWGNKAELAWDEAEKNREISRRMAGDAIPEGLDSLLSEIREEGREELKQEAIVQMMHPEVSVKGLMNGTSRTAEQQVARDLLFKGEMPNVLPADLYSVNDLADKSQLGIAGPFQSDSKVRQSTTGRLVNQTFEGETDQILEVDRSPVMTEYLSAGTEEQLFKKWKALQKPNQQGRDKFNAAVGEYYGQQALKAIGNTPVIDEDRSNMVLRGQRNDYSGERAQYGLPLDPDDSTAGTDRLIENSVGILNNEIDRSADFRYVDTDGNLTVGDYQMGDAVGTGVNKKDTIRLNVLKDMTQEDATAFKQKFSRGVEILQGKGINPTPSAVVQLMVDDGILPGPKRRKDMPGIRGGKALSDAAMFREANYDDQYRYNTYLFGHGNPSKRSQPRGYMPEEMVYVDLGKADNALGVKPSPAMTHGGNTRYGRYQSGGDIVASVQDLVDQAAAVRLHEDPRVRQLLQ